MKKLYNYLRVHGLGYSLVLIGALIQMYLVLMPLGFLLANILPDDAFYYFEIARNVALGLGSTFDGVNLTNGYHPLWLLVLIGIYIPTQALGLDAEVPVRTALVLSVVLNVGTGLMLYHFIGKYVKKASVRSIALMVWVLNPFVLYETINGLETSLALFMLLVFISVTTRFSSSCTNRQLILIGLVAGLMILARVDQVFYFIAFLSWLFLTQGIWESRFKILVTGLSASALVIPWLLWNKLGFGMWLTSAAEGNAFVNQMLTHQSGSGGIVEVKHVIYHLNHYTNLVIDTTGIPILLLVFVGILAGMFLSGVYQVPRMLKSIPIETVFVLGFGLLFFADAGLRFTGRTWYFISFNLLVVFLFAAVLPYIEQKLTSYKKTVMVFMLCCIVGSFAISWNKDLQGRMVNQLAIYNATLWANEHLEKGSIIGAFNSGVAGYFSIHRVVNLDGLVNNKALEALKESEVWNYMTQEKITHIADGGYYFTNRYSLFLGVSDPLSKLKEQAVFPIQGDGKIGSVSVYEVIR